ncbi:MAG: VCBS repeat-containing protein [Deltaproteobacteria bacterium]
MTRATTWVTASVLALLVACSGTTGSTDSGRGDGALDATVTGDARSDVADGTGGDGPLVCADNRVPCNGVCCATGTSCGGGYCCADTARCGGVCCGPDHGCEGAVCVLSCGTRARCGAGATEQCCTAGDVCYLDACVTPGATCTDTTGCAAGEYCEPTIGRCLPRVTTGDACEYHPPTGVFTPRLKWAWSHDATAFPTHNQVMMQPVVANLTDDNGDGRIDHNDVPDVVFNTFVGSNYWYDGILRAISGADGSRIWPAAADPGYRTTPGASIAIAELDATSPGPEIVTCTASTPSPNSAGHVIILHANGTLLREIAGVPCGFSAPAIADMDSDGVPEIAVRNLVFHADGTVLPGFTSVTHDTGGTSADDFVAIADMNSDGVQDVVHGNSVVQLTGTDLWRRADLPLGYVAIADLDADRQPDVAVVQASTHSVYALSGRAGLTLWGPVEVNRLPTPSGPSGGGPPTIADFNGDHSPDVATAGGYNYLVLDGRNGLPLWFNPSRDTSSRVTGSSVFDFEGDGPAEVVYNDELQMRVYRGNDGTVLYAACSTSGTLWEYPVVVDVDNDDHAEIVVMANNYAFTTCADGSPSPTGIQVFADAAGNWVRTRRIWNEHTYHVTNIDEDGNVPRVEAANWATPGLNNFRQNVGDGLFDAPDLAVADLGADYTQCPTSMTVHVRVVNRGRAGAPAGIPVTFYYGAPAGTHTRIGRAVTTRRLLPGESEVVSALFPLPAGMTTFEVYVIVNDPSDMPITTLHECRDTNNTSTPVTLACALPG